MNSQCRGKQAADTSREFVLEVEKTLQRLNMYKPWVSALISGRELIVQSNETQFRRPKQILHMMAYATPKAGGDNDHKSPRRIGPDEIAWDDPAKLMGIDQRAVWWQKYRLAAGIDPEDIPNEFLEGDLGDITRQPLLLYLVALSFGRGKLKLGPETNLNEVYADLINAVWERGWEKRRPSLGAQPFSQAQFVRILEEIGLAAWHDERRTTTIKAIRERFKAAGLTRILEKFEEGAEAGVTRLLTAFYFRQYGDRDGDKTFEFTHKSFGEYLAACRIVRTLDLINQDMLEHEQDADRGKDIVDALAAWVEIAGPAPLDEYYTRFLDREIARSPIEKVAIWQNQVARMITASASSGTPVERLKLRPSTFHEELRHANFRDANLNGARLRDANLQRTSFEEANLTKANLIRANLTRANLKGANLTEAEFGGPGRDGANLAWANLVGANLTGANLSGVNLQRAKLNEANLTGANLTGANLTGASLTGANLTGARLKGTILADVDLTALNPNVTNIERESQGAKCDFVPPEEL